MFVPSESIFFDIHEHFEDIVQRAHRARVVIVSPSLLMLSIQVVMSLLRDVRMREQAHIIQQEVIRLMDDVGRLDERVRKLGLHFSQANKDIEDILDLQPQDLRARREDQGRRGGGRRRRCATPQPCRRRRSAAQASAAGSCRSAFDGTDPGSRPPPIRGLEVR